MKPQIGTALFALVAISLGGSAGQGAEKQTAVTIEPIYRAHIFRAQPKQNPQVTFEFAERAIPGLWDALGVQVFEVRHLFQENRIPRAPFVYREGRIVPLFADPNGSLLSIVLLGDALYYTYGFGSGIYRSQIDRLRIKDGQPEHHSAKAIANAQIQVEKTPDGRLRAAFKRFPSFGGELTQLGWIDAQENQRLKVIDDAGGEVVLPIGIPRRTHEETMRERAKLAPYVQVQDAATRRLLADMGIIIDANNIASIDPAMNDPAKIDQLKTQAAVDAWNLLTTASK